MKKNRLVILLIFLFAANIALVVTILVKNNNNDNVFIRRNPGQNVLHDKRDKMGRFEMHLADQLNLDNSQRKQLMQYSHDFHRQKDGLNLKIDSVREIYFENLASENTDQGLLDALADSLGNYYAELVKLDFLHYKNLKSICTPEQANQLDSLGRLHINKLRGDNCKDGRRRHGHQGRPQ